MRRDVLELTSWVKELKGVRIEIACEVRRKGEDRVLASGFTRHCFVSSERAVEWKVVWLDSDGMEIDSTVSTWAARMIQPYEVCALKGTAPTQAAVDMMFYVRRAK